MRVLCLQVIHLQNCDVYCYKTDADSDLFGDEPVLWSFNYFFHNKKKRKVVFFSCRGISKTGVGPYRSFAVFADAPLCLLQVASEYSDENNDDYDYGMAQEMEIKSNSNRSID